MPPRRKTNSDLPPNLYPANGGTTYRYRDPRNGRYHGMGSDRKAAIADAKALNAAIYAAIARTRHEVIIEPATPKLSAVILIHAEVNEARAKRGKLASNTLRSKKSHGEAIRRAYGDKPIGDVTVADMASLFDSYVEAGKERAAQAVRSEAIEIWNTAMSKGFVRENIPAMTRAPDVAVKRSRLTLENWRKVREVADSISPWLGLSMDLAILTAQRIEDIAAMEFRPSKDATAWVQDGSLWVIQGKTGNRVCIPLSLRLEAVGIELGEVVARCRDRNLSRHLIHHRLHSGAQAGDAVHKQTISKTFTRAVRESGIEWEAGRTAPTFHEQRSLSIRLHTEQGTDAQALAGHKDAATTAVYRDVRGSEWIEVKTA